MNYVIRISESAAKEIESLPKKEVPKIIAKIEGLSSNPKPPGSKKLVGTPEKLWRIRSGDYRIVYAVEDKIKIVEVRSVGNRKDVYQ